MDSAACIFFSLSVLQITPVINQENSNGSLGIPPSIVKQGEKYILYRAESASLISIPCEATGSPAPEYKWKKNGEDLILDTRVNMPGDDGTLVLDPAITEDEAYYQCWAHNQYGADVSVITHLERAVLETPPRAQETVFTKKEGQPLIIPCLGGRSIPDSIYGWTTFPASLPSNAEPVKTSKRITTDQEGNLYFSYVEKTDEKLGDVYQCRQFNTYLGGAVVGRLAKISVEDGPPTEHAPDLMKHSPRNMAVLVGSQVKLECIFSGRPAPSVSWNPKAERSAVTSDGKLFLYNVSQSNEGQYECKGENSQGEARAVINLVVHTKPSFASTFSLVNTNVTSGNNVKFNCAADCKPECRVAWSINGETHNVLGSGSRRSISPDGSEFSISPAYSLDTMVIQCNASNPHGYAFASAYLRVEKDPLVDEPEYPDKEDYPADADGSDDSDDSAADDTATDDSDDKESSSDTTAEKKPMSPSDKNSVQALNEAASSSDMTLASLTLVFMAFCIHKFFFNNS